MTAAKLVVNEEKRTMLPGKREIMKRCAGARKNV